MSDFPHTLVRDGQGGQLVFPPFIPQANLDKLATDFEVQTGDVFVVTFPKCGTTWMEQVVHLLLNNGEQGEKVLTDQMPWIEAVPSRPVGFHEFLAEMDEPRVFTSHLPYSLMPGLDNPQARYVYVARNPKDTAVSYYYHDRSKMGYEGSWVDHLQLFLAGKLMFGDFFTHLAWFCPNCLRNGRSRAPLFVIRSLSVSRYPFTITNSNISGRKKVGHAHHFLLSIIRFLLTIHNFHLPLL